MSIPEEKWFRLDSAIIATAFESIYCRIINTMILRIHVIESYKPSEYPQELNINSLRRLIALRISTCLFLTFL